MSTFKTEALVLTKKPLRVADRLYILYTRHYGKVEAKVRSAARSQSKLAGHLEPFCISSVMIAKGRELETIAGAKLIKNFSFTDFKIQSLANLASDLVNRLIKPAWPQQEIYQLLESFLAVLERQDLLLQKQKVKDFNYTGLYLLSLRFIWQMLIYLGYKINLEQKEKGTLPTLTSAGKKLLTDCLKEKNELTILQSSSKVVRELVNFTQEYLRYFLESDLKSFYLSFYA
ncbi:DNA repair protein RecO [Patescibacteria group bacterium]|nr:DNA repair protein RecO [Patescibacteria group bacterium]